MVTLPLEIVAAGEYMNNSTDKLNKMSLTPLNVAITIQYWEWPVSSAVWVTIFLFVIITFNLFPVKGYGETEFWLSLVKIIAIVGFMYAFDPSPLLTS